MSPSRPSPTISPTTLMDHNLDTTEPPSPSSSSPPPPPPAPAALSTSPPPRHPHCSAGATSVNPHSDPDPDLDLDLDSDSEPIMPPRRWARKAERYCCLCATYFPLAFVYGMTTWATWVIVTMGSRPSKVTWVGSGTSFGVLILYGMLNWCYTTAVFTDPGSTTNAMGYSTLPTHTTPITSSLTVKANGELRFCKKCQARKPDRAHHCSTCRRCVLKMDHHCPWLATCIGLRNHKSFLLFLIYTTLFCLYCFFVSGSWVYKEMFDQSQFGPSLLPINFVLLAVLSGIIALVIGAFTGWHIMLATKGQTTIECLEKTRYLSPLRKTMRHQYNAQQNGDGVALPRYGQQLLDIHANALPGVTRPEEGETLLPPNQDMPSHHMSYEEMERDNARRRYDEYLDEQDSEKLPNAFDLGPKRNLLHLFGPSPVLWFVPIKSTTGDGWTWEASPKWIAVRERVAREREAQRERERAAGWGEPDSASPPFVPPKRPEGAGRHYLSSPAPPTGGGGRRTPSKADRVLGRDPNLYEDEPPASVSMRTLDPHGRDIEDDLLSSDDGDDTTTSSAAAERQAMNVVTNGGWARNGASGLLRNSSSRTHTPTVRSPASRDEENDDGVD